MKIVILGSGGRLGAALLREWRAAGEEVIGLNRRLLDIGNLPAIRETLNGIEFAALVNCAALTGVDYCEQHGEEAHRVNAAAVGTIADVCTRKQARCIHLSTDYVFDGQQTAPYTEEDEARPLSVYGASKLDGERCLHAVSDRHLAVRVSWLFGPDRPSFVEQMLQRALASDRIEAIADKVACPTYTVDAARWLRPLLDAVPADGQLHLCNAGACTWQEYGQHALDCAAAAGVKIRAREVEPIAMSEMKTFLARRPRFSALSTGRLAALTGFEPRPWQEALDEYIRTQWAPAHR